MTNQVTRVLLLLVLSSSLSATGCRRRKPEPAPAPAAATPASTEQPAGSSVAPATPASPAAAPKVNVEHLQAGPEFSDLNNLVAGFEIKNKRLPNMEELKRAYGGRPLPAPPGYTLVIDPKSKKVKAVPGS